MCWAAITTSPLLLTAIQAPGIHCVTVIYGHALTACGRYYDLIGSATFYLYPLHHVSMLLRYH